MTVNSPETVTILVLIMAAFLLIQSLAIAFAIFQINRQLKSLESVLLKVTEKSDTALQFLSGYVSHLDWVREKIPTLAQKADEGVESVFDGVRSADEKAANGLRVSRDRVRESGRKVELILTQFTRQTSKVDRWLRVPTVYVSAVIDGVLEAAKSLVRGQDKPPTTHSSDRELFI